ncbi:MAG TPA: hypothetical protein VMW34_17050 [Anaerolineales bacterium]|nr:hypothetical protein [Anaerolineales bacterium]
MVISRVLILYEPRLYSDLINELIDQLGLLDIVEVTDNQNITGSNGSQLSEDIDVVILPLDESGDPKVSLLPQFMPGAKLVAFSPDGSRGLRRMPGELDWVELRPFGLSQLIVEILRANPVY